MMSSHLKTSSSSSGLLKSSMKPQQQDLNNSISPANNTTSFISNGGGGFHDRHGYGGTATPGRPALDSSYDAHYGTRDISNNHRSHLELQR